MRKFEALITTQINKWFSAVVPTSSPWEVKDTRGRNTFALRELKEHQRNYLLAATTQNGCTWKIPDIGPAFPPFDVLHYKNTPAYVVIAFLNVVVAIEIRKFLEYFEGKEGRTITEMNAISICDFKTARAKLPK